MGAMTTLWLDDPAGDAEHRLWDGTTWTDKVLVDGEVRESAMQGEFPPPELSEHEQSIRWQVQHEAKMLPVARGGETLGTARVLVVNHLASYHVPRADYRLMDDRGRLLGRAKRKAAAGPLLWMRVNSPLDHHLRVELEVRDAAETLLATLDRRRFGSSAAVYVRGPLGEPVGTIALEKRSRPPQFRLLVGDDVVGRMEASDATARRIAITDAAGEEIGRVEKTPLAMGEGVLTSAQRFVLQRSSPLGTTLDELVGYAPLALDLMLGSIYTYEKERQMKHDPRLAKLDR